MPIASSSPCTVPSSPSRPCSAMNAASGSASSSCAHELRAGVDRHDLVAELRAARPAPARPSAARRFAPASPRPSGPRPSWRRSLIDPGAGATASPARRGAAARPRRPAPDPLRRLRSSPSRARLARLAGVRSRLPPRRRAARRRRAEEPVSAPISPVSGRAIAPIRRMPSRMSSLGHAREVQPHRGGAAAAVTSM